VRTGGRPTQHAVPELHGVELDGHLVRVVRGLGGLLRRGLLLPPRIPRGGVRGGGGGPGALPSGLGEGTAQPGGPLRVRLSGVGAGQHRGTVHVMRDGSAVGTVRGGHSAVARPRGPLTTRCRAPRRGHALTGEGRVAGRATGAWGRRSVRPPAASRRRGRATRPRDPVTPRRRASRAVNGCLAEQGGGAVRVV